MTGFIVLMAIAAGVAVLVRRRSRRRIKSPPFRYVPMTLVVGPPGTGKSASLNDRAIQRMAEGREIGINWRQVRMRTFIALRLRYRLPEDEARRAIRFGVVELRRLEDYIDAIDRDQFVMEAQDVFRNTDWALIRRRVPGLVSAMAQMRHRRVRYMIDAHRFGSIDAYVRDGLIGRIMLARPAPFLARATRRLFGGSTKYPLITLDQIKTDEDEKLKTPHQRRGLLKLHRETFELDPVIANCYDNEGGVFMSPLDELKRREAKEDVLLLGERTTRELGSRPADGLPALGDELVIMLHRNARTGGPLPHELLAPLLGYSLGNPERSELERPRRGRRVAVNGKSSLPSLPSGIAGEAVL